MFCLGTFFLTNLLFVYFNIHFCGFVRAFFGVFVVFAFVSFKERGIKNINFQGEGDREGLGENLGEGKT